MDPFWCITLSVLVVSKFWKRERGKKKIRRYYEEKDRKESEKQQAQDLLDRVDFLMLPDMLTPEEKEAEKKRIAAEKQKEKDVAELRKQGFDEELITTIIPTINNGQ